MSVVKLFPRDTAAAEATDFAESAETVAKEARAELDAAPRPARRVQLRIPLDDPDEAIKALAVVILAAERAMRGIQSSQKQRRPELLCPLTNARMILERANSAVNSKRKGR
jgi:hypothetical protein